VPTHVVLSPGMFGFGTLASFQYFEHLERAFRARFERAGREVAVHVCAVHPTASIRRRAAALATFVAGITRDDEGPVHLVGHSTGGLDARLVAAPGAALPGVRDEDLAWLERLASITTLNTPHFGTPLAAFFATVSGQRVLYASTALTVIALKLGAPPLAAASALLAAFGRVSGAVEVEVLDRATDSVIRVLDETSSRELRSFLRRIRDDQGGVVQLMPEAMDMFAAAIGDRPGVRRQSVASFAPGVSPRDWVDAVRSPWGAISAGLFAVFYNITAREDEGYPCRLHGAAAAGNDPLDRVARLVGERPPTHANDGVVPLYSQVWGELVWCGKADHLDIVGHFAPARGAGFFGATEAPHPGESPHVDWLRSGSRFDRPRFDQMIDRVFAGMVAGEREQRPG
jgi:triacylglycerol lipase